MRLRCCRGGEQRGHGRVQRSKHRVVVRVLLRSCDSAVAVRVLCWRAAAKKRQRGRLARALHNAAAVSSTAHVHAPRLARAREMAHARWAGIVLANNKGARVICHGARRPGDMHAELWCMPRILTVISALVRLIAALALVLKAEKVGVDGGRGINAEAVGLEVEGQSYSCQLNLRLGSGLGSHGAGWVHPSAR